MKIDLSWENIVQTIFEDFPYSSVNCTALIVLLIGAGMFTVGFTILGSILWALAFITVIYTITGQIVLEQRENAARRAKMIQNASDVELRR